MVNAELKDLVLDVQSQYRRNRYVFIPSAEMTSVLTLFGGRPDDAEGLAEAGLDLPADPTLQFRRSRNGRFIFEENEGSFTRLEFQPFVLTAGEDFVREDTGKFRRFRGLQDDLQCNSIFKSLLAFKAFVAFPLQTKERNYLDYVSGQFISTVFHLRTITKATLLGEPAREGVHSDGVDHTMTTLLFKQNMRDDSAVSAIHSYDQRTGIAWDEVEENHVVAREQHLNPLDTLLIADHERKHSVSPVFTIAEDAEAIRDMLIVFSRRPSLQSHPSAKVDSKNPHPDLPLCFNVEIDQAFGAGAMADSAAGP